MITLIKGCSFPSWSIGHLSNLRCPSTSCRYIHSPRTVLSLQNGTHNPYSSSKNHNECGKHADTSFRNVSSYQITGYPQHPSPSPPPPRAAPSPPAHSRQHPDGKLEDSLFPTAYALYLLSFTLHVSCIMSQVALSSCVHLLSSTLPFEVLARAFSLPSSLAPSRCMYVEIPFICKWTKFLIVTS